MHSPIMRVANKGPAGGCGGLQPAEGAHECVLRRQFEASRKFKYPKAVLDLPATNFKSHGFQFI